MKSSSSNQQTEPKHSVEKKREWDGIISGLTQLQLEEKGSKWQHSQLRARKQTEANSQKIFEITNLMSQLVGVVSSLPPNSQLGVGKEVIKSYGLQAYSI